MPSPNEDYKEIKSANLEDAQSIDPSDDLLSTASRQELTQPLLGPSNQLITSCYSSPPHPKTPRTIAAEEKMADEEAGPDYQPLESLEQITAKAAEEKINGMRYFLARISLSFGTLVFDTASQCYQLKDGLHVIPYEILGFLKNDPATTWTITSLYFLQSATINGQLTNNAVDKTFRLAAGEISDDWVELSPEKDRAAKTISVTVNAYALFSDLIAAAFYLKQLNFSKTVQYTLGTLSALSHIPTECLANYLTIRSLFAQDYRRYSDDSKLYRLAKFALKLFAASEDLIESFVTVTAMFAIQSPTVKWVVLILSLANALNDFSFNGKISEEALDALKEKIISGEFNRQEIILFIPALFSGLLVGDSIRNLILDMLVDPDATLPKPLPPRLWKAARLIIGWGTGLREGINATYSMYSLERDIKDTDWREVLKKATAKLQELGRSCYPQQQLQQEQVLEEDPVFVLEEEDEESLSEDTWVRVETQPTVQHHGLFRSSGLPCPAISISEEDEDEEDAVLIHTNSPSVGMDNFVRAGSPPISPR